MASCKCEDPGPPVDIQLLQYNESYIFNSLNLTRTNTYCRNHQTYDSGIIEIKHFRNHPSHKYKVPRNVLRGINHPWNTSIYLQDLINTSPSLVLLHLVNQYRLYQWNRNKTIQLFFGMIVKL